MYLFKKATDALPVKAGGGGSLGASALGASFSGAAEGINPMFYAYSRDQVQYLFNSRSPIAVNQHSSVLIFTSDFAPDSIMGTGYLGTTTANFSVQIPVPTPEPASLLLLTLASPFLLKTRRHK